MRILLYLYGSLVGEPIFCKAARYCHKRELNSLFFMMSYRRKNGKFLPLHFDIMERVLISGK